MLDAELAGLRAASADEAAALARDVEQARIDLVVELAARREEADREDLLRHQEAVAQTQRYLDESNLQLADAIRRANDKRLEADTLRSDALDETTRLRRKAQDDSDALLDGARDRAQELIADAERRSRELVDTAERRLDEIRTERDAIAGYVSGLRGLMGQIEGFDDEATNGSTGDSDDVEDSDETRAPAKKAPTKNGPAKKGSQAKGDQPAATDER
ncbi:hypothetical protein ACH61_03000 [Rathayibacter tanaceti]|uniref:Uncharacterized protein n=1 Tax=Rathayibacter tanaceti TaxID=1671680 RepID=A0A162IZ55_9MICO|nr:hypothetical protein ACH61_03000 [Rathayibacter tanaceti]